jgi:hypothetical protein
MNYQVLTLYAFCRLIFGDGVSDVSSYRRKSNVTSFSIGSQSSNGRGIATYQRACAAATTKQSCYAVYDDAGNNLNIRSLLKFKFYLTNDLRINEINAL